MEVAVSFLNKSLSTGRYKNHLAGMVSEGTEGKQLPIASTDPGNNSGPQNLSGASQGRNCRRGADRRVR